MVISSDMRYLGTKERNLVPYRILEDSEIASRIGASNETYSVPREISLRNFPQVLNTKLRYTTLENSEAVSVNSLSINRRNAIVQVRNQGRNDLIYITPATETVASQAYILSQRIPTETDSSTYTVKPISIKQKTLEEPIAVGNVLQYDDATNNRRRISRLLHKPTNVSIENIAISEPESVTKTLEQWTAHGISLWATSRELTQQIQPIIEGINSRYNYFHLPNFSPHITLLGDIKHLSTEQVALIAQELSEELKRKPIPVTFTEAKVASFPSYSVFLDAPRELNPELISLIARAYEKVGVPFDASKASPHASLIYDQYDLLTMEDKQTIALEVKGKVPKKSVITNSTGYLTEGAIEEWREISMPRRKN